MAFQYRSRSADDWRKREEQKGYDRESFLDEAFDVFKVKEKDNWVRFLPPTPSDEHHDHYGMDIFVHFGIGPNRAQALCLRDMKHERCPICEAADRADKAGDEELRNELRPKKRVLVWVLDLNDKKSRDPKLWAMPYTVDRDITAVAKDRKTGRYLEIDHPEQGYDVSFDRTGEKRSARYIGFQIAREPSSVDPDVLEFIEENPLRTVLRYHSYKELLELFEGGAEPENEREEPARERERPSRTRGDDEGRREEEPDRGSRSRREPEERERPSRARQDEDDQRSRRDDREPEPDRRERPSRARRDEPEDEPPTRRTSDRGGSPELRDRVAETRNKLREGRG